MAQQNVSFQWIYNYLTLITNHHIRQGGLSKGRGLESRFFKIGRAINNFVIISVILKLALIDAQFIHFIL